MAKRKKKIKIIEEKTETKNSLTEDINKIVKGMYYLSETDAEIFPFVGTKAESVTGEEILKQTDKSPETPVEERDFTEFFDGLTKLQDWFGDEEKVTAGKYSELKELLENILKDLKVFKIGRVEFDVYIVGLDDENILAGIQTKAVET